MNWLRKKKKNHRIADKSITLSGFEDKGFVIGVSNGEGNVDPYRAHSITLFSSSTLYRHFKLFLLQVLFLYSNHPLAQKFILTLIPCLRLLNGVFNQSSQRSSLFYY